jgi:ribosome-associated toxin RatA of RatAB toxin-antitoxin module
VMNAGKSGWLSRAKLAVGAAACGLLLVSVPSFAGESSNRKVTRYEVKMEKTDVRVGAARASVKAPTSTVRSVVTDFSKYSKIISKFEQARVVGKSGDKTDVYLQVPILKGAAKVWAIIRFEPPQRVGNEEIVRGKLIKGNVKRLDAIWRIRQVDDKNSELDLELFIVPDMPAPRSLVLSEERGAAAKAVTDTRKEAERRAQGS